ncbi:MAG: NUDIX domain-containing protein [bacterium]
MKIRNSVKILLLNDENELLLMCVDDPKTTIINGKYLGPFWFVIGGEIEQGESTAQAAIREIHEETGILKEHIKLGPIVWHGEFDLILAGTPTHIKEQFIVAKTKQKKISLENLTQWEKVVVKKIVWFSLDEIKNCNEIIYPIVLLDYLEDIIFEKYPDTPIEIDLAKQP